jgi:hypothetical protein
VGEVEAQVYIFLVASSVLVLASKIVCGIEFKVITSIQCIVCISCLSSLPYGLCNEARNETTCTPDYKLPFRVMYFF